MSMHPFDEAIALAALGEDSFSGCASPAYTNMVGAFGGISAATMLNAVMQHPDRLGDPVSLTVNYAAGLVDGPFTVTARPARTNRSTQHWMVELLQPGPTGAEETVLTATVLTATRRSTWSISDMSMPSVPPAEQVPAQEGIGNMAWLQRYEMRPVTGAIPATWDGAVAQADEATASLTLQWLRDVPPRAMDFCSLAAFADIFYPRIFLRRATRVLVGTVSMTVYFHVGSRALQAYGDAPVLGQARGQVFGNGFFDQSAQLWSESGTLLVTSHQMVYYKE